MPAATPIGHLRNQKPSPCDAVGERGIDDAHEGMQNARPQNRCEDSAEQDGMARQHGQHGAIEQPDQHAGDGVDDDGDEQPLPVKGSDLGA